MVQKYRLVVLSNATEGDDDAFNAWYDKTHLRDVLNIPDYVAAQRFRLTVPLSTEPLYRYCAIYEVETSNPQAAIQRLLAASGTPEMVISDKMHPQFYGALYEELGGKALR